MEEIVPVTDYIGMTWKIRVCAFVLSTFMMVYATHEVKEIKINPLSIACSYIGVDI